ncbi:MAG: ABC transporter ATP-binding protein [Enterococcus aquimarinus]
MLNLKNITKTYKDKKIFQNATFEAQLGEIVLLTGKSGIGKSTLLDIIAGIKEYDSGTYYYQGIEMLPKDDEKMSAFRNEYIGYILQDFALIEDYTVMENVLLPTLYNNKIDKKISEKKARALAERFDLIGLFDKKVKHLSGGQKQRVAIIRSLILDPLIILADEPTTNLDNDNFEFIMQLFKELRNAEKTIVIATHDHRIHEIADVVYQVENYKLIKRASVRNITKRENSE